MKKTLRRALILLPAIALALVIMLYPLRALQLCDTEKQEKLLLPLWGGDSFSYEFLHSVQKTPVRENFTVADDGRLLLVSTRYYSLGVGLPFLPEEGTFINDDGVFEFRDLNREFEYINFGLMPLAQQHLILRERSYYFDDHFASGATLRLEVVTCTPVQLLINAL